MLKSFYLPNLIEAGVDEAGRGCLAGPVVAAAVILPNDFSHSLINDSKKLSENARLALDQEIKDAALAWAIGVATPAEIDKINILNASFLAMHRAIEGLNVVPEYLLIDGNRFSPFLGIPHHCMVKGDAKYLSIASASILAKNYRDLYMQTLSMEFPHFQWQKNKGYPTKEHYLSIQKNGVSIHHRNSFNLKL